MPNLAEITTKFHNGLPNKRSIVSMSLKINLLKKFDELDADAKNRLVDAAERFRNQLNEWIDELKNEI